MNTGIFDNKATEQRELWVEDKSGLRMINARPRWQVDAEAAAGQVLPWGEYPDRQGEKPDLDGDDGA
ncbi:MAG TPA: hypothetical protein VIZ86_16415 [Pseudomonas sp.]